MSPYHNSVTPTGNFAAYPRTCFKSQEIKNFQPQSPISLPICVCDSPMLMACFWKEFHEQRNKKRS